MADHRLGPLKRSDLQFHYPPGASGDDNPALRGTPDNDMLNRTEWYEMLYFVNKFANTSGNSSAIIAKKTERLIKKHLPADIRSHANVTKWLLENWMKYGDAPL